MSKPMSASSHAEAKKKNLGQFYTTNYNYILQNIKIPICVLNSHALIVEPFAGNKDLIRFTFECAARPNVDLDPKRILAYDIDAQNSVKHSTKQSAGDNASDNLDSMGDNLDQSERIRDKCDKVRVCVRGRDTLTNAPDYKDKYIITNPPYLAKNKAKDRAREYLYKKYGTNDLYKCFIVNLIENICLGGVIIIPLNFWCSIRASDIQLRKEFLQVYEVLLINVFEEKVFHDTTYTICAVQFTARE